VESPHHPQVWQRFWIANPPAADNAVVLHVRAGRDDPVGTALVHATAIGDRVRLRRANGGMMINRSSERDVVMIAHGIGIAPMKAMLADLRQYREVCGVHLLWAVDRVEDFYDMPEVLELTGPDVTVVPVVLSDPAATMAELVGEADWLARDVYVSGTTERVAGTLAILSASQVPAERIRYEVIDGEAYE
jgi:ferredoxin-NADP reductase